MPLGKNAKSGTYVDDFVHSKNKKFAGKSKKERIKMALGAYYGKHNESVEPVEEKANFFLAKTTKPASNDNSKSGKVVTLKKEVTDLALQGLQSLLEKKMSKHEIEVKAHKGEKVGHGGFKKVEANAEKEYGSKEAGERVAAAVMFKKYGKK